MKLYYPYNHMISRRASSVCSTQGALHGNTNFNGYNMKLVLALNINLLVLASINFQKLPLLFFGYWNWNSFLFPFLFPSEMGKRSASLAIYLILSSEKEEIMHQSEFAFLCVFRQKAKGRCISEFFSFCRTKEICWRKVNTP